MIKVKYISLVNLIMNKPVVKELIQDDLTADNIKNELNQLLRNPKRQKRLLEDYDELKYRLGNEGASDRAANIIVQNIYRPR